LQSYDWAFAAAAKRTLKRPNRLFEIVAFHFGQVHVEPDFQLTLRRLTTHLAEHAIYVESRSCASHLLFPIPTKVPRGELIRQRSPLPFQCKCAKNRQMRFRPGTRHSTQPFSNGRRNVRPQKSSF
jgi:hypothetical protein